MSKKDKSESKSITSEEESLDNKNIGYESSYSEEKRESSDESSYETANEGESDEKGKDSALKELSEESSEELSFKSVESDTEADKEAAEDDKRDPMQQLSQEMSKSQEESKEKEKDKDKDKDKDKEINEDISESKKETKEEEKTEEPNKESKEESDKESSEKSNKDSGFESNKQSGNESSPTSPTSSDSSTESTPDFSNDNKEPESSEGSAKGSTEESDNETDTEKIILAQLSQSDYEKGVEIEKKEGANTRKVVIARGHSPILGDPLDLHPIVNDKISVREMRELRKNNVQLVGYSEIAVGQTAQIFEVSSTGDQVDGRSGQKIAMKRSYAFRQAWAECEALKSLGQHRNIVSYYGEFVIGPRLYLLLELANLGDMPHFLNYMHTTDNAITEHVMRFYFKDIHDGLTHMHSNGFAHRNLNPYNVLAFYKERASNRVILKISDFGTARQYFEKSEGERQAIQSQTITGTPKTMAPEVCDQPYDPFVADVYSLGVILYLMSHNGEYPFNLADDEQNNSMVNLVNNYATLKRDGFASIQYSSTASENLKKLISSMLEPDPSKRVRLESVKAEKWFGETGKCEPKTGLKVEY